MKILELIQCPDQVFPRICYVSVDHDCQSMVNGVSANIFITGPGCFDSSRQGLQIIMSTDIFQASEGSCIKLNNGGVTLKIEETSGDLFYRVSVQIPGFISLSDMATMNKSFRVCILTVSDKGSRGERIDTAGPAIEEIMKENCFKTVEKTIVADEKESIQNSLKKWIKEKRTDLVVVTGGTGLSERDVTPEALSEISDKIIPGIGEYMRIKTSSFTERSILSRSGAHVIDKTLVLSLPGSRRGATQCLNAVLPVIEHAVEIIRGDAGDCGNS